MNATKSSPDQTVDCGHGEFCKECGYCPCGVFHDCKGRLSLRAEVPPQCSLCGKPSSARAPGIADRLDERLRRREVYWPSIEDLRWLAGELAKFHRTTDTP